MRTFDLSPLYRSTVGFDHFADLFSRALSNEVQSSGYPPFNIEKTSTDGYRISVAVAGFTSDDLNVEVRHNNLVITARKTTEQESSTYLHRGIANRAFEKKFRLADHVIVTGASHENGMLHIDLERQIPEALRPRQIEIRSEPSPSAGAKASKIDLAA